jgi:hypothetical protein
MRIGFLAGNGNRPSLFSFRKAALKAQGLRPVLAV